MKYSNQEFKDIIFKYIPEEIQVNLDEEIFYAALDKKYENIELYISDIEKAESMKNKIQLKGIEAKDYLFRELEIGGIYVICSIAFVNGEKSKPFVAFYFIDTNFDTLFSQWNEFYPKVIEEFKVFDVKKLSFFLPYNMDLTKYGITSEKNFILYGATLSNIKDTDVSDLYIVKDNNVTKEEYNTLFKNYEIFKTENPQILMGEYVPYDKLKNWIDKKQTNLHYLKIYKNDEWAGFVVLSETRQEFFQGVYVEDKVIFPKFNGQNIAYRVQNYALKKYFSHIPRGYVFGTIAYNNIASIKSAENSGRKPLYEYVFIES